MGKSTRKELKNSIWDSFDHSVKNYRQIIDELLMQITDKQLQSFHDYRQNQAEAIESLKGKGKETMKYICPKCGSTNLDIFETMQNRFIQRVDGKCFAQRRMRKETEDVLLDSVDFTCVLFCPNCRESGLASSFVKNPHRYECILDETFCQTEKGNILLVHEEEFYFNAWIQLEKDIWLEIAYRHHNYPALTVQTTKTTDKALAEHINKEFSNGLWVVRKANIEWIDLNKE